MKDRGSFDTGWDSFVKAHVATAPSDFFLFQFHKLLHDEALSGR